MSKVFNQLKLSSKPQRFHHDIVEYGFQGKQILGLHPIEEQISFLPWLQAVENQESIFTGEWVWDLLKSSHEISCRGVNIIEQVRIVRVRRAFVPLRRDDRVLELCGLTHVDFGFDRTLDCWLLPAMAAERMVLARGLVMGSFEVDLKVLELLLH